ncbi:DUF2889 domain-containing protein [Pseudomonas sp. H9]|uniref:DUF2889 domain-containing protein n=1 Tax=Pseudomonas sp. H9 TaxID=483968 RepID=UPI0010577F53|nr:DUF2889 domain-containing protein [Pseudomonas sp. H9]TDF80753.1 DUF2889 domain-containing protein [Pseudomonas sp. H9]
MTQSTPRAGARTLLHTRCIECRGFLRDDGLYDIEGRLQDLTNAATDLPFHRVPPSGHIHDMQLLMTIDSDMLIRHIEARMPTGASPFCVEVLPNYGALTGLRIGPGFLKALKAAIGSESGCTHMTELLERMAKTAMQTLFSTYRQQASERAGSGEKRKPAVRPWVVGTCHTYRAEGDAVRLLWPDGLPDAVQP